MKVLHIEDDAGIAGFIAKGLREAGHACDHAADGVDGLHMAREGGYDVWVVDRMLPGLDGLSLIRVLRSEGIGTPALVLSALGEVDDRVEGLRAGGDDYLVKPFAFAELLARLEALARRAEGEQEAGVTRLKVGNLEMALLSREVRRAGQIINLQPQKFQLLKYLIHHTNQMITHTILLKKI